MTSPNDERIDRKIDQQLMRWHTQLDCDAAQRERMRNRFLEQLAIEQASQNSSVLPKSESRLSPSSIANQRLWRNRTLLLSVAALLLLAVGIWQFAPHRETLQIDLSTKLGQAISSSFSAEDILRNEQLYCELDRVFEHNVPVIRQCGDRVEFDFGTRELAVQQSSPVILRFVLQERASDNSWQTLHTEDVIGGNDQQFTLPQHSGLVVKYWSHLLPDQSLWAEVAVSTAARGTEQSEQHCLSNDPKVVWSEIQNRKSLRLVLAFQRLKRCEPGVF